MNQENLIRMKIDED